MRSDCVRRFTISAPRWAKARSRLMPRSPFWRPLHARFITRATLAPGAAFCRWPWSIRASPVEASPGPNRARRASQLFTEGEFNRIRECGGHACGWLFYDRSKNNRRRWCEMEVCGNRARAAAARGAEARGLSRWPRHWSSPRPILAPPSRRWRRIRPDFAAWRCRRSCRRTRGSPFRRSDRTLTGAA